MLPVQVAAKRVKRGRDFPEKCRRHLQKVPTFFRKSAASFSYNPSAFSASPTAFASTEAPLTTSETMACKTLLHKKSQRPQPFLIVKTTINTLFTDHFRKQNEEVKRREKELLT
jgi:hypothetical protein